MADAVRLGWSSFRSAPAWLQVIAWFVLWPLLGAAWVVHRFGDAPVGLASAGLALVIGGSVWWPMLFGLADEDGATVALEEADAEAGTPPQTPAGDPASGEAGMSLTATPAPAPAPAVGPTPTRLPATTSTPASARTSESLRAGVPDDVQVGIVERVVDGDTIWVQATGEGPLAQAATHNIRLLQIDTPETQQAAECWGAQATAFAEERLAPGSTVYLQADREDTDRYGRFLRYAWTDDGRFFNAEAVVNGHAEAVLYEPNDRHIDAMRSAEQKARDAERGMWGQPCDYDGTLARRQLPAPTLNPRSEPEPDTPPAPAAAQGTACHPSYTGACVPVTSDVDCAGGSDNGAEYVGRVEVVGPDDYGLDRDNDGIGCEAG